MGRSYTSNTTLLTKALEGVNLPQIKTLILPPNTYPLLQHCPNVEDVICTPRETGISYDDFFRSLMSNRDSKLKRLAIPLVLPPNPPRK